MITVPTPPVRGQVIRADLLAEIINTLRQLRPIAGAGIRIEESYNGITIAATAQEAEAATDFDYRFRVSLTNANRTTKKDNAETTETVQALKIRKGSLYKIANQIATAQAITIPDKFEDDPTDEDAWLYVPESGDAPSSGSLFLAWGVPPSSKEETEGESSGTSTETTEDETEECYYLDYGSPDKVALFVIADVLNSSSTNGPVITQRTLGDLYTMEIPEAEEAPAAWTVRLNTLSDQTEAWQIFSPLWVTGRTQRYWSGAGQGSWGTLPYTSGTLYAYLTWKGTAADDGSVTWAVSSDGVQITNSLSDVPEDVEPVAAGDGSSSSSSTEAVEGSRSIVVTLGSFSTDADGATVWEQVHVGAIVEQLWATASTAAATASLGLGPFYAEGDYIYQDLVEWAVDDSGAATYTLKAKQANKIFAPTRTVLSAVTSSVSSSSSAKNTIATQEARVIMADTETSWLTRKTVTPGVVTVKAPANETELGAVLQAQNTFEFFSDVDPTDPDPTTILETIVKDANETTSYSSGTGSSSSSSS